MGPFEQLVRHMYLSHSYIINISYGVLPKSFLSKKKKQVSNISNERQCEYVKGKTCVHNCLGPTLCYHNNVDIEYSNKYPKTEDILNTTYIVEYRGGKMSNIYKVNKSKIH